MQLQTAEIEKEIRKFVTQTFLFGNGESLNENVPLPGSVIDSQGIIDLVAFVQQRFDIELQDEEVTVDNFASVKTIAALIENKLRAK
jgi:acyl carrier protein